MEAKDAISAAKQYIAQIYEDEGVFNIGLEEIEYMGGHWAVTVGFSRKWDRPPVSAFATALGTPPDHRALGRTYKVVQVNDEDGAILGVKNRTGLV